MFPDDARDGTTTARASMRVNTIHDARRERVSKLARALSGLALLASTAAVAGCGSEAKPVKSKESSESSEPSEERADADDDSDDDDDDARDEEKEPAKKPPAETTGSAGRDSSVAGRTTPDAGAAGLPGRAPGAAGTDSGATMGTGSAPPVSNQPPPDGKNCLKGSGDFNAKGPYKVKKKDVTIGSQGPYTIFYPDPLEAGCPHPLVAWGNGTAVTGSDTYAFYQDHAASWGIIVIASHNDNVGSGAFHKAGLDYMYAQNKEQGSEFFGKVSERAGTSGHSQGGAGANVGASHPNVQAIGNVQGAFGSAPKGKAFLCLTGTEDIAIEGCKSAVNSTSSPALYANWQGGTHTGTATLLGFITGEAGTKQYMRLYSGWFRCFLADDSKACAMFQGGKDCPVCKDQGWAEIFAKNY